MKPGPLPQISVLNRQRQIRIDRTGLEAFARYALPLCRTKRGAGLTNIREVTVILVSDRRIAELHRRFMQIDGPTDVITFQHGEILISVETARRQARRYQTTLVHELQLYLVHGLLHLQGFDDHKPAAQTLMERTQERIAALARAEVEKGRRRPVF